MPDLPLCGYLFADGSLCRSVRRERACEMHEQTRWSVCAGCGRQAVRECPHYNPLLPNSLPQNDFCRTALCPNCVHAADGSHEPDEGAFVKPPPNEQQQVKMTADNARAELLSATSQVMLALQDQGLVRITTPEGSDRVAAALLDELGARVVLSIMTGIVRASNMLGEQN